jgi:hypothetical protein
MVRIQTEYDFGLRQSEWFSGKEKIKKKITMVRAHPLHVPISEKNPTGITIRDRHIRRLSCKRQHR